MIENLGREIFGSSIADVITHGIFGIGKKDHGGAKSRALGPLGALLTLGAEHFAFLGLARPVFARMMLELRAKDEDLSNLDRRLTDAREGRGPWIEDTLVYLLCRITTQVEYETEEVRFERPIQPKEGETPSKGKPRTEKVVERRSGRMKVAELNADKPGSGKEKILELTAMSDGEFQTYVYTAESDFFTQHAQRGMQSAGRAIGPLWDQIMNRT